MKNTLDFLGYTIIPKVICPGFCQQLYDEVQRKILTFTKEFSLTEKDYLKVVNRWKIPGALFPQETLDQILFQVIPCVEKVLGNKVSFVGGDVICKPEKTKGKIPFHQDLPYVVKHPYDYSLWIPLRDVFENSSPLEVIPETHRKGIKPPVDFWNPNFVDTVMSDVSLKSHIKPLQVSRGEGILFSSLLFHGSGENSSSKKRIALVLRLKTQGFKFTKMPKVLNQKPFGMYTCESFSKNLLLEGLKRIFKLSCETDEIFATWEKLLQIDPHRLPMTLDIKKALVALRECTILSKSSIHQRGGDGEGRIYKNLWFNLLQPLENYLSKENEKADCRW